MKSKRKIRYAVVGLGHLSQTAILPAFKHSRYGELAGLVSGSEEKGAKLAKKYKVPVYDYKDYEVALTDEKVDAAFIVLPNTQHREFTVRAAQTGVHVLCEKPMAANDEDCLAMIRACAAAKVKLMVAYRLHFAEADLKAIEYGRSGRLGELRAFNSLFTRQVKGDNIRAKAETGGGPLLDIGVYCLNAARYLFGAEPTEVSAMAATCDDPRFKEIDEMVSVVLRFPKERLASFTCSFGAHETGQYQLIGTKGVLQAKPAYSYTGPVTLTITHGDKKKKKHFPQTDQFAAEMDYFSECIVKNRKVEPSGEEGLADLRVIEAIQESARTGRAVKIKPVHKEMRPTERQKMKRPKVKKEPALVKAKSPHR